MEFSKRKKMGKYDIQRGKFKKPEEIYDDGSSAVQSPISAVQSPLNKWKQLEQNSMSKNPTPAPKPKPPPPTRNFSNISGGGYLGVVGSNDKIPKLNGTVSKGNEAGTESNSRSVKDKEAAKQVLTNFLSKRDSLVKIPPVFREAEESSQLPKVSPKPKPLVPGRKNFDTNNNSKPDTKETAESSVPNTKNTADKKMTVEVEKEKSIVSQGGSGSGGLTIAERQKLLAPKIKPDSLGKSFKSPTPAEKPKSPAGTGSPKSPKFSQPKAASQNLDFAVELRKRFVDSSDPKKSLHRVSVKSVIRNFDTKKFKIAPRENEKDIGPAPDKPPSLCVEIDWEELVTEFQNYVQEKGESNKHNTMGIQELEEEEFYDDCGNMVPPERVSFIEPMTEEEELAEDRQWKNACLPDPLDLPRPPSVAEGFAQENYDDAGAAMADEKQEGEEADELYEPLPDEEDEPPPPVGLKPGEAQEEPPEVPPLPPQEPPRPPKDSKESEKERKKKEKEEKERKQREEKEEKERKKKLEKEQKKKEQELKNMEKTFKIAMADLTKNVGQGTIKATVTKVSKTNLAVQEGQKVEIIRMNKPNPEGKFLVRMVETQAEHVSGTPYDPYEMMGYVDSSNIELMEGSGQESSNAAAASNSTSGQDDESIGGEMYEAVEGEAEGEGLIEEGNKDNHKNSDEFQIG